MVNSQYDKLLKEIRHNLVPTRPKSRYLIKGYNRYVREFGLDVLKLIDILETRITELETCQQK